MNGYYNDFDNIVFETFEERQEKIKKQRRLFSRVFLALVVYILTAQLFVIGVYAILTMMLSAEKYLAFEASPIWSLTVSCLAQYFVAFPVFRLMLIRTRTSKGRDKEKLTGTDFFLLFVIGEALMYAGNLIGNFINSVIGGMLGRMPENSIADTVSSTPVWLIFICMVVLAPIFEELIFRKLMIDRLSVYGDKTAIIFSSVAFGLMHGNLYQFFYATLLGALFGYVYTKTRNVRYTIYMHALVNFLGSIVALPVQKAVAEIYEILDVALRGEAINLLSLMVSGTVLMIYSALQYGLIIGGIIALVQYVKRRKITISPDKEIFIPDNIVTRNGIVNTGAIIFITISLVLIVLNFIMV